MPSVTPHIRYDVFLSSTWEDFKNTRPIITQALQKAGYVARGMEQFPAMNDEVFEYIKKVIDECSYYVVISGSRYGSISASHGRSYTQLEFEYAKSQGISTLCFLLEEGRLRLTTDVLNEDLVRFRDLLKAGRNVDFYSAQEELPAKIIAALNDRLAPAPKTFWINSNDTDLETHTRVKAEGLIGLNAESNNADHSSALRESTNVFAMLNDGYGWTKKYLPVLRDRFADTSKDTTIVLMDPESPSLPAIAQRSNKAFDEQVTDIWESVERLIEDSGIKAYRAKRLRVLGCQQPISGCYFIFDRHIIWNPYLTRFRPPQLPRIELSNPTGKLMELLLTDAEVIRRELVVSKKGDLVRRFSELPKVDV